MSALMNTQSTDEVVELRPATATEIVIHHATTAVEIVGHATVGISKSVAQGFWAGVKKGWNQGKPESAAPKYFMTPDGQIIEVK